MSDTWEAGTIAGALPLLNTRIHLTDGPLGVTLFTARWGEKNTWRWTHSGIWVYFVVFFCEEITFDGHRGTARHGSQGPVCCRAILHTMVPSRWVTSHRCSRRVSSGVASSANGSFHPETWKRGRTEYSGDGVILCVCYDILWYIVIARQTNFSDERSQISVTCLCRHEGETMWGPLRPAAFKQVKSFLLLKYYCFLGIGVSLFLYNYYYN